MHPAEWKPATTWLLPRSPGTTSPNTAWEETYLKVRMNPGRETLLPLGHTWRFMGSNKWGHKSLNMGYKQIYPTYNPTYS